MQKGIRRSKGSICDFLLAFLRGFFDFMKSVEENQLSFLYSGLEFLLLNQLDVTSFHDFAVEFLSLNQVVRHEEYLMKLQ